MAGDDGIPGFSLTRLAPAKINLALHVVGQRPDGYHLLESLVTFADAGDRVGFSRSDEDSFTVSGPFSGDLPLTGEGASGNLVLKARDLLRAHLTERGIEARPVHLHLEKNLPVASGIGGGSTDAAATLLGLLEIWEAPIGPDALQDIALRLGADVPMCLKGKPLIARGIGEELEPLALPAFPMLLVNPLIAVSTPVIFRMLTDKSNPALHIPPRKAGTGDWIVTLKSMRNDLEPPARRLEPAIADVSDALLGCGAAFVRMSGSGATCFGIFADAGERDAAAAVLSTQKPDWYVLACNSVNGEEDHHGRH
ncbi:4-(cytidine 5'-diphospho)-2-C-methyl-D-erythritol kinase [Pararhizobium sp. BT-229]|uniref:4-(cytidine 5'-diphospho)-2-C-methyl-D-erythritol kinase n=1 Tax=Pararhizobium sp. BT-229 TaxID=2986923 RepID=UPI0021F6DEF6|nr:4-(cytidine 5'-diphospho)-2-C-methyl-D-erythritol kinase [Pararhizobium sp. BT-229]MCV9963038.1 4-(cytidine 5'-diphospho)-2-C-methyl-D-erythritol kinase [Pararhizobium sp. BT-229]